MRAFNSRSRDVIIFIEVLAFYFAVFLLFVLLFTGDLVYLLLAVILFAYSLFLEINLPEEIPMTTSGDEQ